MLHRIDERDLEAAARVLARAMIGYPVFTYLVSDQSPGSNGPSFDRGSPCLDRSANRPEALLRRTDKTKNPMIETKWIVLARHGPSSVCLRGRIAGNRLGELVNQMQNSGIADHSEPPSEACALAQAAGILVSSDLARSRQSAGLLVPEKPALSESVFREAEVPTSFSGSIVLQASTWIVLARALWHFRAWPEVESRKAARARARDAATRLEELADQYRTVFLVGHGYFNQMIAAELRRRGWRGPRFPAKRNWGSSRYWRYLANRARP